MSTEIKNTQYYPALDGLRGLAILLVLLYHNFSFIPFFNFGWLGVDLFFVLSGYLITNILVTTVNTKDYYKNFYLKRILRIFPLYYFSFVLLVFVIPLLFPNLLKVDFYRTNQHWFWLYLQNWLLIFKSSDNNTALNHFWSLAVEEQFYLIWPIIVALLKDAKRLLIFCLTLLFIVIIFRFHIGNNTSIYSNYNWIFLFTRIDGILLGATVALILKINPNIITKYFTLLILFLAGINFFVYYINKTHFQKLDVWSICGYTTFSAIFCLLTFELINPQYKFFIKIISFRAFRILGKYSFGLYIFHWPIFVAFNQKITNFFFELNLNQLYSMLLTSIGLTICAFLMAVLSYHSLEKFFLRLKDRINLPKPIP